MDIVVNVMEDIVGKNKFNIMKEYVDECVVYPSNQSLYIHDNMVIWL